VWTFRIEADGAFMHLQFFSAPPLHSAIYVLDASNDEAYIVAFISPDDDELDWRTTALHDLGQTYLRPTKAEREAEWKSPLGAQVLALLNWATAVCQATPITGQWSRSLPNQRLKLTARGGRLRRKRSVLLAAAAGRSLSAIR
jgi:hypothetical protein